MCENFQILKKMKKQVVLLITALTCAFFNFDAASEELISREVTLSNGNQVPASHIFTASESPWTFNLLKTNAPGEWTFYVLDKDSGKYEAVVKRSIGAGTKSFKLDPHDIFWRDAARFSFKNYDLFKGRIEFISYYEEVDTFSIYMQLAPSRPVVENTTMTYEYDWEYDCFNDNSKIQFDIIACDFEELLVHVSGSYYFAVEPDAFVIYASSIYPNEGTGSIYSYAENTDWGTIYRFSARNEFAYSYSTDTIFTTDYITDLQVLARLEELKKESGVSETEMQEEHVRMLGGNHIYVPEQFTLECIADVAGRRYRLQPSGNILDISRLQQGFYIIVYRDSSNKLRNLKIWKK